MTRVLEAANIRKSVRDGERTLHILDGVSLQVAEGESVALLGPSGSGKSSLLTILGALDPHFEGDVSVLGQSLRGLSDGKLAALRNHTMGFVFQAYNLLSHMTALENVAVPARFAGTRPDWACAQDLLAKVGLADKGHRLPSALSGGERQRVAIARALYQKPTIVLCDEPTGNLDRHTAAEILTLFDSVRASGVAFIVATHDDAVAKRVDRVLTLHQGRWV